MRSKANWLVFGLIAIFIGWLFSGIHAKWTMMISLVPFVPVVVITFFKRADWLLCTILVMAFFISLLSRYVPGIPFGLSIDGMLLMLVLVLIFNPNIRYQPHYLSNPVALALLAWLLFTFLQLGNPLATSRLAWIYANRGLSFYPFLLVILAFYALDQPRHLRLFLLIWALISVFGTFWGLKQLLLGVSETERQWLNAGAASTHVLFGKLRVFSFYSDAAQFGASQAHTALVFGLIGLFPSRLKYRWLYLLVALLSLIGMLISGTRGALAILAIGGVVYLLMTKNFKIILIGTLLAVGFFIFLKYTTLLQSNYQINRLRSAFDANDPSLRVRLERERVLEDYLSDKPFGSGIGSAGYWGKRFSPGTFLAELGTDGHYTRLWMETGKIGLWLYWLMLLVLLTSLGRRIWRMPNNLTRQVLLAVYAGFAGICAASYTNGLLTQLPTGPLVFIGLALAWKWTDPSNYSITGEEKSAQV